MASQGVNKSPSTPLHIGNSMHTELQSRHFSELPAGYETLTTIIPGLHWVHTSCELVHVTAKINFIRGESTNHWVYGGGLSSVRTLPSTEHACLSSLQQHSSCTTNLKAGLLRYIWSRFGEKCSIRCMRQALTGHPSFGRNDLPEGRGLSLYRCSSRG